MKYALRFIKNNQEINQAAMIVGDNYNDKYKKLARKEIKAMFSNPVYPPRYLVAESQGQIVGLVGFCGAWFDYGIAELFWVNVAKTYQNQGIGVALVARALKEIKKDKKVKMVIITAKIPKFYINKFGFEKLSKIEKDEYLMIKRL